MADHAGIAERADQRIGLRIVIGPRHRPEPALGEARHRRQRMRLDRRQIGRLECLFPRDPVGPRAVERRPEHLPELARIIGLAALVAAQPFDHFFGRVVERQVAEEAGAIEIFVDPDLEVDRDAFRFQPDRIVEARVVADLGAEHHFVIGALAAAEAARHPGFHEHRAAFEIPARHADPRRRQIGIEDRFGMLLDRHRLAAEEFAPPRVGPVPHVHRRDVNQLVIHQREEALARAECLERQAQAARRRATSHCWATIAPRRCRSRKNP